MLFVFPLRAHKVVGTDILHAAALLYVAGFGHIVAGNVDMHAVAWLLIGSVPGVLIGSHYSVRLPEAILRLTLANVLAISGLKLVNVPNVYLLAGLCVSAVLVGALLVREQRRWRGAPGRARCGRAVERTGLNSRGLAPVALDPARRRAAGWDGGRLRGHAGAEDRAEPDPRAADRQGVLTRLRLRHASCGNPVQAAEARPGTARDRQRRREGRQDARPRQAPAPRDGQVHLERPRRPGPLRPAGGLQAARPPDRPAPHDRPAERDAGRHDRAARDDQVGDAARLLPGRRRAHADRVLDPVHALRARSRDPAREREADRLHPPTAPDRSGRLEREAERSAAPGRGSTRSSSPPRTRRATSRRRRRPSRCASGSSSSRGRRFARRPERASAFACRPTARRAGGSGLEAERRSPASSSCEPRQLPAGCRSSSRSARTALAPS